jgi:hypothetical protein
VGAVTQVAEGRHANAVGSLLDGADRHRRIRDGYSRRIHDRDLEAFLRGGRLDGEKGSQDEK